MSYKRTLAIREKQSKANRLAWQDSEIRLKYLTAAANKPVNLDTIKAMHNALIERRKDPEWMANFIDACSKSATCRKKPTITEAFRKAQSERVKNRVLTEEYHKRLSEARKERVILQKTKDKQSETQKENWANPEFAKRMAISQHRKPNSAELLLESILNRCFPNEWKYTGDGQVWIEGRNPDFVNINGKKQVIELFGCYWHIERARTTDDVQNRINHYKKYGFDCLIIWDSQLTEEEVLKCLR